jgi:cold shock CspA family protein
LSEKYERIQAPVKFYSIDRGYGFLKQDRKLDIFFTAKMLHRAGLTSVKENDMLEFDLVPVQGKGGRAINIKKVAK